jgi:hypothetical protein
MANNPVLFNAALCGASGGAQERWLLSTSAASYAQFAAAATAFATAVDAAIAVQTSVSSAQSQLLQSLCQGVLSTRLPQSVNASDYTAIAQAIAALYAALATALTPGNIDGFLPRGTGAVFQTFDRWSQNETWAAYFMTAAEQTDFYNCTRTIDLQPKIQLAIDYCMYRNSTGIAGGPKIKLGGGIARTDRPINMGYGIDLRSGILEGDGQRFGGNFGNAGSGTAIVPTFNDAPAIVVQGGWYVQVKDMSIFGPNQNWVINLINNPAMTDLVAANWIDSSFPASAGSQFAVQCAIGIDPYAGAQPAVHYPNVIYPTFLGAVAQYNKQISSNVTLTNVNIQGFVAAVGLQCCNTDANGDYVRLENVTMFYCAYGFVWGNSQARVTTLLNCTFTGINTCIDNKTFGNQGGENQILVENCSFNEIIRVMNMDGQNGPGPRFEGCFSESTYSLGTFGTAGATFSSGISFECCEWGFSWWDAYGVPIYTFVNAGNRARAKFNQIRWFLSGFITNPFDVWGGLHFSSGGATENADIYSFTDCLTIWQTAPTQLWQKCANNATVGMTVDTLSTRFQEYSWRITNRYNLDTGANLGSFAYGKLNQGKRDRCLPAYGERCVSSSEGADPGVIMTWRTWGIGTDGTAPVIAGRNITMTWTAGWTADTAWRQGGDVGDIIVHIQSGTKYYVFSRAGNTFQARAQTGYDRAGNLLSPPVAGATFWGLNCRRYTVANENALYGDLTAASPTVPLVNGDTSAATPSTNLVDGDWVYQEQEIDRLFSPDAGCRITAHNDGAHTITMNSNAILTRTHLRLAVFTRAPMPNGTATP